MKNRPTCYTRHPYTQSISDRFNASTFDVEHAKIVSWLNTNVGRDNWGYINDAFLFANERDALIFALTFL